MQQPGVLDRDNGLRCKVHHQRYLLICKRANVLAIHRNCADQLIVLEHRHRYKSPCPGFVDKRYHPRVMWVGTFGPEVSCVHDILGSGKALERHTLIVGHGYYRLTAPIRDIIGLAMHCNRAICVAFA